MPQGHNLTFSKNIESHPMKTYASIDKLGMSISTLCIVHCLFLPIIGIALPIFGAWSEIEWIHKALVLLAIPVALNLITSRAHRGIRLLALLGVSLLSLAAFWHPVHEVESAVTICGAAFLLLAHLLRLTGSPHSH